MELHFDTLRTWLPDAKLIHIYRHPLDVISSYTKQKWAPKNGIEAAKFYVSILKQWFMIREKLPNDSYIEMSLEELVSAPTEKITQLLSFCDLDWDENILSVDLSKSNSNRWKKDLKTSEIDQILEIVQPVLESYGYGVE